MKKKTIVKLFKNCRLPIVVDLNLNKVNFRNVTWTLANNDFDPTIYPFTAV